MDPLAGELLSWTPYQYTFNNPLIFVDPDGRMPTDPPFEPDHKAVRDAYVNEAFTEIKAVFNLIKVKAIEIFVGDGKLGASVSTDGNVTGSIENNSGKVEIDGEGQIQGSLKFGDFANMTFGTDGTLNSASVSLPINKAGTRIEGGYNKSGDLTGSLSQRFGKFVVDIRALINLQENRDESNRMINDSRENTRDVILGEF